MRKPKQPREKYQGCVIPPSRSHREKKPQTRSVLSLSWVFLVSYVVRRSSLASLRHNLLSLSRFHWILTLSRSAHARTTQNTLSPVSTCTCESRSLRVSDLDPVVRIRRIGSGEERTRRLSHRGHHHLLESGQKRCQKNDEPGEAHTASCVRSAQKTGRLFGGIVKKLMRQCDVKSGFVQGFQQTTRRPVVAPQHRSRKHRQRESPHTHTGKQFCISPTGSCVGRNSAGALKTKLVCRVCGRPGQQRATTHQNKSNITQTPTGSKNDDQVSKMKNWNEKACEKLHGICGSADTTPTDEGESKMLESSRTRAHARTQGEKKRKKRAQPTRHFVSLCRGSTANTAPPTRSSGCRP